MNAIHIVTFDFGGAAVAAIRISAALNKQGVNSEILVRESRKPDTNVINYSESKLKYFYGKVIGALSRLFSNQKILVTPFGINISSHPTVKEADVIFLHWTGKFLSLSDTERLVSLKKRIIIVLHDMWWFTGGCNYDDDCGEYKNGCVHCRYKPAFFSPDNEWKRKFNILNKDNVTIVTLCKWMMNEYKASFGNIKDNVFLIKNPINTEIFTRSNNNVKRQKYKIGFGADQIGNIRKGFDLLLDALKNLDLTKYTLIVFGDNNEYMGDLANFEITNIGYINKKSTMVELLNDMDVFVAPSRQENYANVVLEALSCSVPVVAFNIGGMPDFIEHKQNGYLAKKFDTDDLARGIEFCAINSNELGVNARNRILRENSEAIISKQYLKIMCIPPEVKS